MITFWLTLILIFLGSLLPSIIKWVTIFIFKTTEEELRLRDEFKQLKNELVSISAVDEFARYARIKRKMNKLEEEIMSKGQTRMDSRESLRWKFTRLIQAIIGSVLLYIAVTSRSEPVMLGLKDWFWPLGNFLQYPTGIEGALSTVMWLFICNSACRSLIK